MTTKREVLRTLARATFMLLAAGGLRMLTASGPVIGMVVADGSFQVDHSQVWGNATLFDGSVIETGRAVSHLRFSGGMRISLGSGSRATVHPGRLVLESGMSEVEAGPGFEIESRSLRISASQAGTVARIRLDSEPNVVVAAVKGGVRVMNAAGLLVANIEAGKSLDLEPKAGASAPTRATGCLLAKDGQFILAEQTADVVLQVTGPGLSEELGNRVTISGIAATVTPVVPGTSQAIKVAGLERIAKGGCSTAARKVGASPSIAAGAGATGATGATGVGPSSVAVIGGVATAATVGGLAAVGGLPGQGESTPAVSR